MIRRVKSASGAFDARPVSIFRNRVTRAVVLELIAQRRFSYRCIILYNKFALCFPHARIKKYTRMSCKPCDIRVERSTLLKLEDLDFVLFPLNIPYTVYGLATIV